MDIIKDCKLNEKGFCTCYLVKCEKMANCAPKLIIKRNMDAANKLINEKH